MVKKYSRTIFALHSWAGIIAGLGILFVSLTGCILLFHHEIDHALYEPELVTTAPSYTDVSYDKALTRVQKTYPHWNIRIRLKPDQAKHPLLFDLRRPGRKLHVYTHPVTGEILQELPEQSSVTMIALKLHYSLMAGLTGRMAIMFLGILFLISLLTGFYIYRKKIWQTICLHWNTNPRTRRSNYALLHNIFGTWTIVFNLLLAATGLYLSYLVVANGFQISTRDELPDPPEFHLSLDKILSTITNRYPGFIPSYVRLPIDSNSSVSIQGSIKDDFFLFDEYANAIKVDPDNGKIKEVSMMRDQPMTTQFADVMKPLHTGGYGGIILRVFYLLVGLSVPILSVTGYLVNWHRKN